MLTGPKIPSTNSAWKKYQKGNSKVSPQTGRTYHNILGQCTLKLCAFYTTCNSDFYYDTNCNPQRPLTEPSEGVENNGRDNKNFDLILHVSDTLGSNHPNQYKVVSLLGCGTFGQVVKAVNKRTKETVAIKVIKSQSAYFNQAKTEIAILKQLQDKYGKDERFRIVRLLDYFVQSEHLCLVFELLHNNLYELLKSNAYKGLSLNVIRVFLRQLLNALAILQECHIIHCDMKPENILVSDGSTASIKLIDFGSACFENQTVYTYIQSRYYRSPEVLCGYPYNSKIDVWSLGCILAELFLGLPLFPGVNDYNQMARICEMCGYPPQIVLEKGKNSLKYFRRVENSSDILANTINPNTNNPLTIPTVSPSDIPDSVPTQSLATRRNQQLNESSSTLDNLDINSKTPKSQSTAVQSKTNNASSPAPKDKKRKKPKEVLGSDTTNKYDVDDSYLAEGSSAEETIDESLKKTCSLKELLATSELETTNSSNNISTESGSDMGTPNKTKRNRHLSFDPPPPPTSFPVINNWQLRTEEDFCKITNSQPVVWKRYFNYTQLEDLIMHMPYNDQVDIEQEKLSRAMFADFLRGLLIPDFRERWTAEQALEHPFVREDGSNYYKGPWKHHEYVQQENKRIEEELKRSAEIAAALHHQAFAQHSRSVPIPRQPHLPMAYPASWSSLVSTSPGYTSSPTNTNTSSFVPTPVAPNWGRPMQSPPSPRSYFFSQAQARATSQFPSSSLSSDASCSDADNVLDCGEGYIYGGFELCPMNNNYPNMGPKAAPWAMAGPRSGGMHGGNRPPHQMIPGYMHSMAPGLAQDMLGISPSLMPHPAPWMPPHLQLSQNQYPNMAHVQQKQQQQQSQMKNNQKKHQKHGKGNRPSSWSDAVHIPPPTGGHPHVGSVPMGQITPGPQMNQIMPDTQNNNNNNNNNNNAFRRHKTRNKSGSGLNNKYQDNQGPATDYGDTIFAMDIQ